MAEVFLVRNILFIINFSNQKKIVNYCLERAVVVQVLLLLKIETLLSLFLTILLTF